MIAIEIENLSKQYALGKIGSGTLYRDLNVWWARMRGKPNPYQKIGQISDRTQKADGDFVWALKDINLKIEDGEVVGIIGSNGAGKSTLLKILSRVTTPTTGRITTYGRVASLLEVGTGFHGEMTGRENIYMNGAIMGMTRAEITRKLDEIVDFAGVAKYIDTPVKRYSSGMTVRLGFAVAAFLEPEILVVDEVLAVGDAEFQKKAIGKMQDVAKGEGRTVLFVSHNMAAVRKLCKRGVVLCNGGMAFDGSASDAIDQYMLSCTDSKDMKDGSLPIDPNGSKDVVFETMTILDDKGQVANPRCGKPFRINIKATSKRKYRSVVISLVIRNIFETPLLAFSTYLTKDEFSMEEGEYQFELSVPKCSLTAGNYMIGLFCKADGDMVYGQKDAYRITVEDDDFFNNGRHIPVHLLGNAMLCEHKWEVKHESADSRGNL